MRTDFMTWEDWECPSPQLKCLIQDLVCGLECNRNDVTMALAPNGYVVFTGPKGTITFKQGGISTDADNKLSYGSDGLPYFNEKIVVISSLAVVGADLVITYTNETGLSQQVKAPVADICAACSIAINSPLSYISADANNRIVLGSDNKLYVAPTPSITAIPTTDVFNPSSGTLIVLTQTPSTSYLVQVFRNGLRLKVTEDYTRVGTNITFTRPFGTSGGATNTETVLVDYYRV